MQHQTYTPPVIAGAVYFIEFVGGFKHAQVYCGSTALLRLAERFEEHTTGRGAKITAAAAEQGIEMRIIGVIPTATLQDARRLEHRIKQQRNNVRWLKTHRDMVQ